MGKWWQEEVVYQIYPRSFQDSNGDGIGDIPGIISRLDEIKALGVGIIWLSPVYKSPDADNGYDISDYMDINPKFGTMADMERLFKEAKARGIRIIMDLVINHTSDEHKWFQESRDKDSPYRDYYIWRPGRMGGKLPPNNWTGFFMGSTWEYDEKSGEYYLHLFDKKQPDLNYHNPKVLNEVKEILRFWLDKGAAGFRCDVINVIYKTSLKDGKPAIAIRGLEHYKSQEGNHRILKELRKDVLSKYDCFTVGETVMVDLDEAKMLCEPEREELDMVFYFDHLEVDRRVARYVPKKFKAKKLLEVLAKWQRGLSWNAVYLENHDQPRIVSHYGDEGKYWARSAKMLATLLLTLKGTPYIYQGQEIGMTNFDYPDMSSLDDVESKNVYKLMRKLQIPAKTAWDWIRMSSRDNARTPMQWSQEEGAGFTTGTPWLPINGNYKEINYQDQHEVNGSVYRFYQRMIAFRAGNETLKYGEFVPLFGDDDTIVYAREGGGEHLVVALNFSPEQKEIPLEGEVLISNTGRSEYDGKLGPYESIVMRH
ncbi:oligo-1,6-glucosidase [Lachnospiraceae bacterium PM6-15]|uniref:Alpha-glucosidase n=1 Tax=Ohessyouella blattaphilus TaxID=2949333 RepID=A0ABT1EGY9_9FIRM|nr:alpha-glucosidase [Ohessyouella blattaphilus]MCP1109975.1 alpha-glucosidase [Ohessyouella blattaphilus]MCR8563369.1 alpha-glucosidase [Ohessyouella blattaphilus]MDL2250962.1 alpha-glucosidase [Lachnospiraceae bacterium OttesenSCG-928-J05]